MELVIVEIQEAGKDQVSRGVAQLDYTVDRKPFIQIEDSRRVVNGELAKRKILYLNPKALEPGQKISPSQPIPGEYRFHRELLRMADAVEVDW